MKRNLELTLPREPTGGHVAFTIMLETKGIAYEATQAPQGKIIYRLTSVPYEMVEGIAHDAMSLFRISHVPFLDVMAGLHFGVKRQFAARVTGDDR